MTPNHCTTNLYDGVRSVLGERAIRYDAECCNDRLLSPEYGTATYIESKWVINSSKQPLYIFPGFNVGQNESVGEIPPALTGNRGQTQENIYRNGKEVVTIRGYGYSGNDLSGFRRQDGIPSGKLFEQSIFIDELMVHPIYIPKFNMVLGTVYQKHILEEYHPLSNRFYQQQRELYTQMWYNEHPEAAICVEGNDPTGKISHLYTVINGISIFTKINNHQNATSFAQIRFNIPDKSILEFDMSKVLGGCEVKYFGNSDMPWILGASKALVESKYKEHDIGLKHRYTEDQLEVKIKDAVSDMSNMVDRMKSKLTNAETKLADAEKLIRELETKYTHTTKMDELRESTKQSIVKREIDYNQFEYDKEIAAYKALKERHSYQTSEMNMLATGVKTAAIVLPILATIYIATRPSSIAVAAVATAGKTLYAAGNAFIGLFTD